MPRTRAAWLAAALALAAPEAPGTPAPPRPNILLILADDAGANSLGCLGGAVPTPHLDRLAAGGMTFSRCHAAPMCAPTRDEMMTGKTRLRLGGRPGTEVLFFTNLLQKAGYANAIAGKWFVGDAPSFNPPRRGYDEACILVNGYRHWSPDVMVWGSRGLLRELNQPASTGKLNEWQVPVGGGPGRATRLAERYAEDVAADFLCDFMERRREGPFFAFYSAKLVHVPQAPTPDAGPEVAAVCREAFARFEAKGDFNVEAAIRDGAKRRGLSLPGEERQESMRYLDKTAGRLIAKLDELKIREKTLVLFTSDNGNSETDPVRDGVRRVPGKKGDSRDGGTLVPLVANWPGTISPGSRCDNLVHVQDFLPTFAELAGAELPEGETFDGLSFAPPLLGRPGRPREWFIGSGAHPSVWLERVRKDFGNPALESYALRWVRGLRWKLYGDGRFYDLEEDPAEERPVRPGTGSPEAEQARKRFQEVLDGHSRPPSSKGEEPRFPYR